MKSTQNKCEWILWTDINYSGHLNYVRLCVCELRVFLIEYNAFEVTHLSRSLVVPCCYCKNSTINFTLQCVWAWWPYCIFSIPPTIITRARAHTQTIFPQCFFFTFKLWVFSFQLQFKQWKFGTLTWKLQTHKRSPTKKYRCSLTNQISDHFSCVGEQKYVFFLVFVCFQLRYLAMLVLIAVFRFL